MVAMREAFVVTRVSLFSTNCCRTSFSPVTASARLSIYMSNLSIVLGEGVVNVFTVLYTVPMELINMLALQKFGAPANPEAFNLISIFK